MKHRSLRTLLSACLLASSLPALADYESPAETDLGLYVGGQLGKLKVDVDGIQNADTVGVLVGYGLGFNGVSVEAEYNTGDGDINILGNTGSYDADTLGLFVAYRTPGPAYLKARAGAVRSEVEADITGMGQTDESETEFSMGVGVGIRLDNFRIEGEFSKVDNDANLLSFGLIYQL
ncbi:MULTISPECIES: porin family protein [Spongiibacter]|uniref:porin family protein n=1 Tax=Spongiibacter TaxID=630749 RepID=UPI000C510B82|nr:MULTISPECIES: porin family protein [Spongiibacter]MAY40335.1 hypothetical protein [Spongiibacter sp.]MBI58328.1 hypothetical protein [Spongiibacter sp.]|tara:strand:+ start:264 stop:794 length:531 start_codon:yes stop_codon:yes gene_type:complete